MGDLLLSQYVCMKTGYAKSVTQTSVVYVKKNYELTIFTGLYIRKNASYVLRYFYFAED